MKRLILILFVLFSISSCAQFYGLNRNYDDEEVVKYGFLYNGFVVDDSRELTSSADWIVPTKSIVDALSVYLGGDAVAGGKLKETGLIYWDSPNTGATNEYGFSFFGAGKRLAGTGGFAVIREAGLLWTTAATAGLRGMGNTTASLGTGTITSDNDGATIRLVRDATGLADGITTIYVGNDLKSYLAVVINEKYWTIPNLAETKWRTGAWITGFDGGVYTPISNVDWSNLTEAALCAYDDDLGNVFF